MSRLAFEGGGDTCCVHVYKLCSTGNMNGFYILIFLEWGLLWSSSRCIGIRQDGM